VSRARRSATAALLLAAWCLPLAAQGARPAVVTAERAGRSPAVRALGVDRRPIVTHRRFEGMVGPQRSNPPLRRVVPGVRADPDAAVAAVAAPAPAAPTLGGVQFDGLSNNDNFASFGFRVSPPDTNHDVGPDHIVETTNLLVRIYDKSGSPLVAPFRMSALFAALGGICSTHDDGDPIVLYDPLADRWLLGQFAFTTNGAQRYVTHQCLAVSTGSDPSGDYHVYDFLGPNTGVFGDYPHLGVWPDGYYMTTNQFNTQLNAWRGGGVFAFERERMLAGDPGARVVYFDLFGVDDAIGGMLPADFDGLAAPPPGTPNPFAYFVATEFGDAVDGLRLFDFAVDWAAPASSTFTERAESPLAVAAFNPLTPAGRTEILQAGGSCASALDSIADRLMHRLQYRNRGGSETLVANHTVNANGITVCSTSGSTFRAGVRLYQLERTTGAGNPFAVAQQMTHAPADAASRWLASAASDHQNNLAVGYSVSGAAVSPSVRYTGRLAGDPAGTLQAEATLVAGSGRQTSTGARWGDYSNLAVDPADDCTFWYSQEYYTAASQATSSVGWLTRIGNFKFSACATSPRGALEVTVTACEGGEPVSGAVVTTSNGYLRETDGAGIALFDPIAPGAYDVAAAAAGADSGTSPAIVVAAETTELDLCLAGQPVTTVGNGAAEPPDAALCPGGAATPLDAFTLVTYDDEDSVSAATVTLAAGTAAALGAVAITDAAGSIVYGAVAPPASDAPQIALTPIPVTTSAAGYRVRVTPKGHSDWPDPAVDSAAWSVTGRVTAIDATLPTSVADTTSATITVDNLSPADPAWGAVTAGDGELTLAWTNPGVADFAAVVVLRKSAPFAGERPSEGVTGLGAGDPVGDAVVAYAGAGTGFTDGGLTNGESYYYRAFARDACANHSTGAGTGPHSPISPSDVIFLDGFESGDVCLWSSQLGAPACP
jgi:hypothetical protein